MATFHSICSDILEDTKSITLDDRLSYRFIKNVLQDNAVIFFKQDSEYKKIFKLSSIWKPMPCVKMVEVNISDCLYDLGSANRIKRSENKIPKVYTTNFGNLIKVLNLTNNKVYKEIKPFEYRNITKRQFQPKNVGYFWLEDDYLFIPDSIVDEVNVYGLWINYGEVIGDTCTSPLDYEFPFPDYITTLAKEKTVEHILKGNKQLLSDNNPNNNTNDKK